MITRRETKSTQASKSLRNRFMLRKKGKTVDVFDIFQQVYKIVSSKAIIDPCNWISLYNNLHPVT